MVCLLEPWAVTLALRICLSWGTGLADRNLLFAVVFHSTSYSSLPVSSDFCLHSSNPSSESDFTVFFHYHFPVMSKSALNLGETWSRTQVAQKPQAWCLSCLGRINKKDKDEDWAVKNFSICILFPVLTSHESSSLSWMNVFMIFFKYVYFIKFKRN